MNRNRLIFFAVFAIFHIGAFLFTVSLPAPNDLLKNTGFMFQMLGWIPYFKWITLFGLLLLITDVIWTFTVTRSTSKEKAALTQELNMLKAKLFDLQEASKKQAATAAQKEAGK